MIKLLKYMKPYVKYAVAAPLLMLSEVILELQQPRLMGNIIDIGIANGDMRYIIITGLKMVGIALLLSFGTGGCVYFAAKASQYFSNDLRTALFEKIQSFSFSSIDHFRPASLITRITNDVAQLQHLVVLGLRMMTRAPLICIGGFIMAASLNFKLALILAVVLPILIGLIIFIIGKSFPLYKVVQEKLDRVNSVMRENLSGVRVIKAFVRFDYEKKRFAGANDELMEISMRAGKLIAWASPIMMIVMNATIVAVLWFGGYLLRAGELNIGKIVAFINYSTQMLHAFTMLAFGFIFISRAQASTVRIIEVLDHKDDMPRSESPVKDEIKNGIISFEGVSFKYSPEDKENTLDNINLTIKPGETVAILGETGSGKTTLVSLIPRLYDVTEGRVTIDGIDVRDYDCNTLRSAIGMVLQDTVLFSGSVSDNIKWGKADATDEEIRRAAEISQASEFLDTATEGYETVVGQRGVGISGGQKQRVSIARAVVRNPKILILDDSTSAIDVMTEYKIQNMLKENLSDTTCIIIAQRISSALDADRIIVMKDGAIAEQGTHSELIALGGIYLDIYKSQLGTEGLE
ncbi:MAG: putative ABC transporter ATP-binding protein [Firmicutes bacterium ADurb.Bin193]|nr:MAG: putative ABC transporter ATP-binding protein [Firmicutes bacterium ADurb.Bin193]